MFFIANLDDIHLVNSVRCFPGQCFIVTELLAVYGSATYIANDYADIGIMG